MVFNYLTPPLIISGIILLAVSGWSWHFRDTGGAKHFSLLTLCCAVYSLGYAMEIFFITLEQVFFWLRVDYLGIALLPALLILFTLAYTGRGSMLSLAVVAAMFFIPVITLVIFNNVYVKRVYYLDLHILIRKAPF